MSCDEENGVFADPADRYGFIFCQDGIAQKKKCENNMVFDIKTKECHKEKEG